MDGGSDKPQLDLDGLSSEWDNDAVLRKYLREDGAVVFKEGIAESVKTASEPHIAAYLTPLLIRMASVEGNPQPLVDPLREQLGQLYRSLSKQTSDESQIVADSWATRKFLGFVKMKARLAKPSRVP